MKQPLNIGNIYSKKSLGQNFIIDEKTCSFFNERLIAKKFHIKSRVDPCYLLKAKKNIAEIQNMIKSHIEDGVALTKFIFWIKNKSLVYFFFFFLLIKKLHFFLVFLHLILQVYQENNEV